MLAAVYLLAFASSLAAFRLLPPNFDLSETLDRISLRSAFAPQRQIVFSDMKANKDDKLIECLLKAGLGVNGELQSAYNKRTFSLPRVSVFPTSELDVVSAIMCASDNEAKVTVQSGGHAFAHSHGDLVINMSKMKSVELDHTTNVATIQSGAKLGEIANTLYAQGKRGLPHGFCNTVAIGGHAAFGGFGPVSRHYGLLSDSIISHRVVLANGTIVDTAPNSDLFWALSGAAPSFGIVVSYQLQTFDAPTEVIAGRYIWETSTPAEAASLFLAYQAYVIDTPSELGIDFTFSEGKNGLAIKIETIWLPSHRTVYESVILPLLKVLPKPNSFKEITTPWTNLFEADAIPKAFSNTGDRIYSDVFYAKSLATPENELITQDAALALCTYLHEHAAGSQTEWFLHASLWGGVNSAINRQAVDLTAISQRSTLLNLLLYASSKYHRLPYPPSGFSFVDGMINALVSAMPLGWAYGAYPNFIDPRLDTKEWQERYYGNQYPRLLKIKEDFDPANVFSFHQAVGSQ